MTAVRIEEKTIPSRPLPIAKPETVIAAMEALLRYQPNSRNKVYREKLDAALEVSRRVHG
jgi:hypothetical protein